MSLFKDTAEDYLKLIGNWIDPNPLPVIVEHEGINVVRDDMLPVGSKARGADYVIGHCPKFSHIKEWVYGSCPATGYAQVSLPYVCNKYGKKAVLFMAARSMDKLHEYQKRGIELGAEYHWIKDGMINVTQKRAKDYVTEKPKERFLLPIGLDCPYIIGSLIRVARSLDIRPNEVWSIASSGTLSRSLQHAFPDAIVHAVSAGGHRMSQHQLGDAIFHPTNYKFDKKVKESEAPPFPSAPTYDAKAWHVMKKYHEQHGRKDPVLFWNVAA